MTEAEKQEARTIESDLTEVAYQYAWKTVERVTQHFERLDAKATSLGGFIGVMLTISLTLAPAVFSKGNFDFGFACVGQISYVVGAILLFVSLVHWSFAIKLRTLLDCPLTSSIIANRLAANGDSDSTAKLKQWITSRLAEVHESFIQQAQCKQKHVKTTAQLMLIGVSAIVFAGLSFVIHMTIKTYEPRPTIQSGNSQPAAIVKPN